LEVCLKKHLFFNSGFNPLFELGLTRFFLENFHIHEKLYGREKEIIYPYRNLLTEFVLGHRGNPLGVSGYSGVGKNCAWSKKFISRHSKKKGILFKGNLT